MSNDAANLLSPDYRPVSPDYPADPTTAATAPAAPAVLFDSDGPLEEGELERLIFPEVTAPPPKPVPTPAPTPKSPPPKPASQPSPDEVVAAGSVAAPAPTTSAKPPTPTPAKPATTAPAIRIDLSGPASPVHAVDVGVAPPSPTAAPSDPVSSSDHELTADQVAQMKVLYGSGDGKRKLSTASPTSSDSSDSDLVPVKKAKLAVTIAPTPPAVGSIKQPNPRKIMYWKQDVQSLYKLAMANYHDEMVAIAPVLDDKVKEQGGWADLITWLLSELRKSPHTFAHGRVLSALSWAGIACGQRKTVVERYKLAIGDTPGSDSEHDQDTAIGELAKQKMMKWLWRYALHGIFYQSLPAPGGAMFKRNMVPCKDEVMPNLLKYWTSKKQVSPPQPIW